MPNYSITSGSSNNEFNIINVIILLVIIYVIFKIFNLYNQENMTSGTLTQLMANDSQDVYLKSNVDQLATGNFNLLWNQPTRVANTFMNRGSPLPSSMLMAVDTPNTNKEITDEIINKREDRIEQQNNCVNKCNENPASCGGGAGGYRLEGGFVDPTNVKPYVTIQGNVVYPDSYVGSYFTNPRPDIAQPYPIIINRV